jgi:hypothetical protein
LLIRQFELRVDRHARDLDALGRDAVVNQLLARLFAGDEVELDVVARPAAPEAVTGVRDDGDERDLIGQVEFFEDAREGVLRQWVDADDDVRAPAFEEVTDVADRPLVEEFARLGAEAVDAPVEVLHPVLLVAQQPVVEPDHPRGDRV